jgi:hypothetical protein
MIQIHNREVLFMGVVSIFKVFKVFKVLVIMLDLNLIKKNILFLNILLLKTISIIFLFFKVAMQIEIGHEKKKKKHILIKYI